MINKDTYKRLTGQKWTEDIDLAKEYGVEVDECGAEEKE